MSRDPEAEERATSGRSFVLFRAASLLLLWGANLGAQGQRAPVVSTVDLVVARPAATVTVLGRPRLVHELHVTNFQPVDVVLRRVEVLHGDTVLAAYEGATLDAMIGRPGLRRDHPTPRVVAPGMRAVVYFWIELAEPMAPPPRLRHRVELELAGRPDSTRVTLMGAETLLAADQPTVVLRSPLEGGPWAAIYEPGLKGGHRTTFYSIDGRARIPGRFAVDFIRLTPGGNVARNAVEGGAEWNGFGAPVLAVADAIVAEARDDMPDHRFDEAASRVSLEQASGNHVTLDLGNGRFAFYEHLQSGSIRVRKGNRVRAGQVIGRLGYSGSSSSGPHLHFHVADASSDLGAEGVPFVFAEFEHLGVFPSLEALARGEPWSPAASGLRRDEHPAAMAVIRFP